MKFQKWKVLENPRIPRMYWGRCYPWLVLVSSFRLSKKPAIMAWSTTWQIGCSGGEIIYPAAAYRGTFFNYKMLRAKPSPLPILRPKPSTSRKRPWSHGPTVEFTAGPYIGVRMLLMVMRSQLNRSQGRQSIESSVEVIPAAPTAGNSSAVECSCHIVLVRANSI